jgi:rod shape-determining protein MreC
MQAARVIATGPGTGFEWTVTIDVGKREGIKVGQSVTNGFGLVGRVVRVDQASSVVLLIADAASGVGVRDTRSGSLLLATGAGQKGLTASALDDQADVKVGDHLVSGPAGDTTFVAGVEVGVVTAVTRRVSGELAVTLRTTAPQSGLDLVGVVLTEPRIIARPPLTSGAVG